MVGVTTHEELYKSVAVLERLSITALEAHCPESTAYVATSRPVRHHVSNNQWIMPEE